MPVSGSPAYAGAGHAFGTEDVRDLNQMLDTLYAERGTLGPRGHVLIKNMAEVRPGGGSQGRVVAVRVDCQTLSVNRRLRVKASSLSLFDSVHFFSANGLVQGAANISVVVYIRTYRLPPLATAGLDERLATLKARAQLVYK